MKPILTEGYTHAYVGIVALIAIFMVLFTAVMQGQELPNAPQAAVKLQIPPIHGQRLLLAKPVNPVLGSADWFRERGYFKLARLMPVLRHIDLNFGYDKPKEAGHGSPKSR